MDIARRLRSRPNAIETITMHTVGEPTRITIKGFPPLQGETLLQKRDYARKHCDHARKLVMNEPRGHRDMYGAILVQDTELTRVGEADIGVLFCHNEGYSTMCGHATIALGRFLVDTNDEFVFPNRKHLRHEPNSESVMLRLHAPCGLVKITVPVRLDPNPSADSPGVRHALSDPTKNVSFLSVPSFAVAIDLKLEVPISHLWPELLHRSTPVIEGGKRTIKVDVAFGGAFYAIVRAAELGFTGIDGRVSYDRGTIRALDFATSRVKNILQEQIPSILVPYAHLVERELQFLYGVTVVDEALPRPPERDLEHKILGRDRNLCFFADQQLDRSPTGSCVSARTALGATRGQLWIDDRWEYHSVVSESEYPEKTEPFYGTTVTKVILRRGPEVSEVEAFVIEVEGNAWYIGAETFVLEDGDIIGKGFLVDELREM